MLTGLRRPFLNHYWLEDNYSTSDLQTTQQNPKRLFKQKSHEMNIKNKFFIDANNVTNGNQKNVLSKRIKIVTQ